VAIEIPSASAIAFIPGFDLVDCDLSFDFIGKVNCKKNSMFGGANDLIGLNA